VVCNMQHEHSHGKKRDCDAAGSRIDSVPLQTSLKMFVQVGDDSLYSYLVDVDPELDKTIYEDLCAFEKSGVVIQMNNYEPGSLYELYGGDVARPERHAAWVDFFHAIVICKNPDKSQYIILNRESLHKIQEARWFVYFCLR